MTAETPEVRSNKRKPREKKEGKERENERKRERKETKRERKRERGGKGEKKMSRVNHYLSAFNSQKKKN